MHEECESAEFNTLGFIDQTVRSENDQFYTYAIKYIFFYYTNDESFKKFRSKSNHFLKYKFSYQIYISILNHPFFYIFNTDNYSSSFFFHRFVVGFPRKQFFSHFFIRGFDWRYLKGNYLLFWVRNASPGPGKRKPSGKDRIPGRERGHSSTLYETRILHVAKNARRLAIRPVLKCYKILFYRSAL